MRCNTQAVARAQHAAAEREPALRIGASGLPLGFQIERSPRMRAQRRRIDAAFGADADHRAANGGNDVQVVQRISGVAAKQALREAAKGTQNGWTNATAKEVKDLFEDIGAMSAFLDQCTRVQWQAIRDQGMGATGWTLAQCVSDHTGAWARISFLQSSKDARAGLGGIYKDEATLHHVDTYRAQKSDIEKNTNKWSYGFSRSFEVSLGGSTRAAWTVHCHFHLQKIGNEAQEAVGYTHIAIGDERSNPSKDLQLVVAAANKVAQLDGATLRNGRYHLGLPL